MWTRDYFKMSGTKVLNAFDMAPKLSTEVKPYSIKLKPGQRLNIAGKVVNEKSVKNFSQFQVQPKATVVDLVTQAIRNSRHESAYRSARSAGKK